LHPQQFIPDRLKLASTAEPHHLEAAPAPAKIVVTGFVLPVLRIWSRSRKDPHLLAGAATHSGSASGSDGSGSDGSGSHNGIKHG
jgi:hypothetical protein